ncbi:tetratricopeptide repeat protein [Sneathiella chinensis]|uniref:Tetratricopeptide repeat protein n=1 Tax=Sneathiella chinensis TaxID=349750 RepID=A0ABQ5TYY1_9PROT|nr:tetratricopeptide repeat protein [Sneathiella chinensis]GLQ05070.1 hypothetical protein GCM10007924_02910 [Sneathiella chinensis]
MLLNILNKTSFVPVVVLTGSLLSGCASLGGGNSASDPEGTLAARLIQPERAQKETQQALQTGDLALQAERYLEAETLYRRALELQPDNVHARFGMGEVFLATDRASKALGVFNGLIPDEELGARALQGSGLASLAIRDLEQARVQLEKATAMDANLWRAWNGLGIVYDAAQEFAMAGKAYEMAIAVNPGNGVLHNNFGMSLMSQGEYVQAEQQFIMALRQNSGLQIAETNLRFALAWQGRYLDALSGLKEEQWPEALNNVGFIALQREDLVQAEAYLIRAIELSPSFHTAAHRNLRTLHETYPDFRGGSDRAMVYPATQPRPQ